MKISMKARKGGDEIVPAPVALCEERTQRAELAPRPSYPSKKFFYVLARDPPVPKRAQGGDLALVPRVEKGRGIRPHCLEDLLDRRLDGRDASEGERGGDEGHDLAVGRIGIAVREDERVRVEPLRAPFSPEGLEVLAEEGEIRGPGRTSHTPTLASSR